MLPILVFSILPVVGRLLGGIAGVICAIFVIKLIFETSKAKAAVVWVFCAIAMLVAWKITVAICASAVLAAGF